MVMDYAVAYERMRAKPYAETFRCPGGELCLDFCNTGQNVRGGLNASRASVTKASRDEKSP